MSAFVHLALLLLLLACFCTAIPRRASRKRLGTRHVGGSPKQSASTTTKAHGTTTPATGITAECSSSSVRGHLSAVELRALVNADIPEGTAMVEVWTADGVTGVLTLPRSANSSTAPGSSTSATGTPGESGERRARVDFTSAARHWNEMRGGSGDPNFRGRGSGSTTDE